MLANIHRTKEAAAFSPADFIPAIDLQVAQDEEIEEEAPAALPEVDLEALSHALEQMLGKE